MITETEIAEIEFMTKDNLKLHGWALKTSSAEKGNIVIIHGMKDYSERYFEFARRLNEEGYNVWGLDLRGHAYSEGKRVYFESDSAIMNDLELAIREFKKNDNKKPWFLFGHSAGGSLVTRYIEDHPDEFKGFILSSPLLKRAKDVTPVLEKVLRFINKFAPQARIVDLKTKHFSKDPAVVSDMRNNPLIHNIRIPARTAVFFLDNIDYVMDKAESIRIPGLILHSEIDKVNMVEGSKDLFAKIEDNPKTEFKLYNKLEHDLFHEPEHAEVENDVIQWLGKVA